MTTDSGTQVPVGATAPASSATGTPTPTAGGGNPVGNELPANNAGEQQQPASAVVAPPVSSTPLSLDESAVPATVPLPQGEGEAGKVVTYEPTNNVGLDLALSFLGKLGIGPDHPGMKAAEAGDFDILRAHLSTLGDKARGWEANVALGEKAFTEAKAKATERAQADRKAMLDTVGGEEQWNKVREFAQAATADSPAEKAEVNKALAEGGVVGKAMALYLNTLYEKAQAVAPTKEPAAVLPQAGGAAAHQSQAPGASQATGGPLSPREYTAEVAKLNTQLRGRMDTSPEYAALKARRALWRAR